MITYDDALLCPRCRRDGNAQAALEPSPTGQRQVTVYCQDKSCSFYGYTWYFVINPHNEVLFHTLYDAQGSAT